MSIEVALSCLDEINSILDIQEDESDSIVFHKMSKCLLLNAKVIENIFIDSSLANSQKLSYVKNAYGVNCKFQECINEIANAHLHSLDEQISNHYAHPNMPLDVKEKIFELINVLSSHI